MKTIFDQLRDHILGNDAAPEDDFDERKRSEWSAQFETRMRNRLLVGSYRYGPLHGPARRWDHVAECKRRLDRYLDTGNQEFLVDAANLAMIEYVRGFCHPHPHWSPEDDGEHASPLEVEG